MIPSNNWRKMQQNLQKIKTNVRSKNTYVHVQVDIAPTSFMELRRYIYFLKITLFMIFQYVQWFQALGPPQIIWQST